MNTPHPIHATCGNHIRDIQTRFPRVVCFFRYYNQYWKATPKGFAVIYGDDIIAVMLSLARRGTTSAIFRDLHETPFAQFHFRATDTFVTIVKQ